MLHSNSHRPYTQAIRGTGSLVVQTLEACIQFDRLPFLVELIHGELELVDTAAVNDRV